jgi:hypothetical protein
MFGPGQRPNSTYSLPVRIGLGVVFAAFPAALVTLFAERGRIARWLAVIGAAGSVGFATWLIVHALGTRTEYLEPSNLFGMVVLLCLPAALLARAPSTSGNHIRVGTWTALAGLLTVWFIFPVVWHDLAESGRVYAVHVQRLSLQHLSGRTLHDTGLTQGVVAALAVLGAWYLCRAFMRRDEPRPRVIAFVLAVPALGYAVGTLLTPILFRPGNLALPGYSRWTDLGPHLIEVGFASTVILLLARLALSSLGRTRSQQG